MPVVDLDLANGHETTETFAARELTRVVRVTELTADPEGQLLEALRDPGVPQLGEFWPGEIQFVIRREAFPDGTNAARIVCTYGRSTSTTFNQPDPVGNDGLDVKNVSASLYEIETSRDRGDVAMTLTPPTEWNTLPTYLSTAKTFRPAGEIVFQRVETSPPTARTRSLVGTLNNGALNSYGDNTLLFTRLDANSDDGGRRWNCTYRFQYRADGWKHKDRWRGPDNRVVPQATEEEFDVIPEASWISLGLNWSDSQTPI